MKKIGFNVLLAVFIQIKKAPEGAFDIVKRFFTSLQCGEKREFQSRALAQSPKGFLDYTLHSRS